jgi:hypothetical protein
MDRHLSREGGFWFAREEETGKNCGDRSQGGGEEEGGGPRPATSLGEEDVRTCGVQGWRKGGHRAQREDGPAQGVNIRTDGSWREIGAGNTRRDGMGGGSNGADDSGLRGGHGIFFGVGRRGSRSKRWDRIAIFAMFLLASLLPSCRAILHPPPDSTEAYMGACWQDYLDGLIPIDQCRGKAHRTAADDPVILRPFRMGAMPISPSNRPATGSYTVTVAGASLGWTDMSARMRVGYTACEATGWISSTSLNCKVARGAKSSRSNEGAILVTVLSRQSANPMTGAFSYDQPTMSSLHLTNGAPTRTQTVTVTGKNMASYDASPKLRLGHTACETSDWISDTAVRCKPAASTHSSARIVVTLGLSIGTITNAFTFDSPSIRGNIWDSRQGWEGYTNVALAQSACAQDDDPTTFVQGLVYGCDGRWAANLSIPAASSRVCGPGFVVCSGADAVERLGVTSSICSDAPREGYELLPFPLRGFILSSLASSFLSFQSRFVTCHGPGHSCAIASPFVDLEDLESNEALFVFPPHTGTFYASSESSDDGVDCTTDGTNGKVCCASILDRAHRCHSLLPHQLWCMS